MPVTGVPRGEVGQVVQDFVDNGEPVVQARRGSSGTYTVGPVGAGGAPESAAEPAESRVGRRAGKGDKLFPGLGGTISFARFQKARAARTSLASTAGGPARTRKATPGRRRRSGEG
jgi:hypothetical protein